MPVVSLLLVPSPMASKSLTVLQDRMTTDGQCGKACTTDSDPSPPCQQLREPRGWPDHGRIRDEDRWMIAQISFCFLRASFSPEGHCLKRIFFFREILLLLAGDGRRCCLL